MRLNEAITVEQAIKENFVRDEKGWAKPFVNTISGGRKYIGVERAVVYATKNCDGCGAPPGYINTCNYCGRLL